MVRMLGYPFREKMSGEGTGLNNYSQGQNFSRLAGTILRKFLAAPLALLYPKIMIFSLKKLL
jgi:hypothetical protein